MSIIDNIKSEMLALSEKYKLEAEDKYDHWNEHIKYVVKEAVDLAEKYNADREIVELSALLHDVALVVKERTRAAHHEVGSKIAEAMLEKHNYPQDRVNRVKMCVFNHRSSKNGASIEDICVADADILAHFDNIPMLFNSVLNNVWNKDCNKDCNGSITLPELRNKMKVIFEHDYNDLSEQTKQEFSDKYKLICQIVLGL